MLEQYGINPSVREEAAQYRGTLGRVTRIDRGAYHVVTDTGSVVASLAGGLKDAPEPEDRPAIGDWVVLVDDVVEIILARRSAFRRGDADRLQAQVVAANVDVVFIVHAADEPANVRRLERELSLAFDSGAEPVVLLTKVDLCDPGDLDDRIEEFRSVARDVEIVGTSAVDRLGLDVIEAFARRRTVAFVGKSGVGKSSLVNELLGDATQAVGDVRASDGRGRHTTTHREMFVLPGEGVVIDTPGLRSIGMWQNDEGIARVFADIEALAAECRFRDCTHEHEPGCAVQAAVGAGSLDPARVANHRAMLSELDDLDRESQLRSRLEKKRHAKILSKAVRSMDRKPR